MISLSDAKGHVTTTKYNIRGQPTHIIYPDGTQEHLGYNTNGTLARKTEITGLSHHYSYDALDRVIRTDTYDIWEIFNIPSIAPM